MEISSLRYNHHHEPNVYLAQVLSVTLDKWTDSEVDSMIEVGGNSQANAIYEAFLPEGYQKPHPDSTQEEREKFIRFVIIWKGYSFSVDTRNFIELFGDFYYCLLCELDLQKAF